MDMEKGYHYPDIHISTVRKMKYYVEMFYGKIAAPKTLTYNQKLSLNNLTYHHFVTILTAIYSQLDTALQFCI